MDSYEFKRLPDTNSAHQRVGYFKNGVQIGYYRPIVIDDGFQAVLKKPFHSEAEFATEKEAQDWLKEESKYL